MKLGMLTNETTNPNLGNIIQLEAVRKVYRKLEVQESEIVYIALNELDTYDGEYVLLPMNECYYSKYHGMRISKKIIPIFLGFHLGQAWALDDIEDTLRKFQPIGCRDLWTKQKLEMEGIQAYVSGCGSICFDERDLDPADGKPYIIDIPDNLWEYIPDDIKKTSVSKESTYQSWRFEGTNSERNRAALRVMEEYFDELKRNASMVITRRLHIALPCVAMGIPVVLAHSVCDGNIFDTRVSGIDRVVKVYRECDYQYIDWNHIRKVDVKELKELTLALFEQQIKSAMQKYMLMYSISEIYEEDKPALYWGGTQEGYWGKKEKNRYSIGNSEVIFFDLVKKRPERTSLILYGAGDRTKWVIRRYGHIFYRFSEVHLVDTDNKKIGKKTNEIWKYEKYDEFIPREIIIESPSIIRTQKKDFIVIICANNYYSGAGVSIGNLLTEKYGLRDGREMFFIDKIDNSLREEKSYSQYPFGATDVF